MDVAPFADYATITGGVAAFVGGARFVWSMGRQRTRMQDAILGSNTQQGLVEIVRELRDEIDEVKLRTAQLIPNGGSSLADKIRKHEEKCELSHLQLITLISELVK